MPRTRKSSACVTLVLIGAALAGCGGDTSTSRRASYASKEECLADWGDPKECEEQARSAAGARSYGPSTRTWRSYSSGRGSGASRSSSSRSSSSSSSTSRGGFGSRGSSAS
jgi:hypothetical protein